jgi:Ubiquitin carboxyl-terminal hydrolase
MEPYTQEYLDQLERKARTTAAVTNSSSDSVDNTTTASDASASTLRPAGYYNYHLVGVVVHTGTADSGHYYSFVKERTGSSGSSSVNDASARWLWFNDSNVSVFEQDKLSDACNGGYDIDNRGNPKVCMQTLLVYMYDMYSVHVLILLVHSAECNSGIFYCCIAAYALTTQHQ